MPAAGQAAKAPGAEGKAAPAAEPAAVTPIPLAEMTARAEDAFAHAREVQDAATMDRTDESIAQDLRTLTREIDARVAETRKVLSRTSSIDTLQRIERPWARIARVLGDWSETLSERIADLEAERARLEATAAVWRATLEEARRSGAPPEAIRRIEELQAEIAKASEAIAREHSRALSVQNRIAIQQSRAGQVIAATRRARRDVENHLFVRDGPPIWAAVSEAGGGDGFAAESRGTLEAQWSAVRAYSERQPGSFMLHGIVFLALAATLLWLRTRVRKWVADEPPLAEVADVFDTPVAMALVLSIIGGFWIYPDAPMLWLAILGALVLIPAIIILRRLIEPDVRPVLYALVLFYFVDQVRTVAAPLELVPRLVFLGELLCAALVSGWLMMRLRRPAQPAGKAAPAETRRRKYVRRASAAAFVLAFAAAAANALGYVALSSLLGNALFNSAYVGLMLYALVEILDGLFLIALHGRPLILLASVRTHRMMLARRVRRFVEWVALGLWALYALQRLALRERLFELARNALGAEAALGSLRISLGDVLAFVVVVWASFLVSRFVRFLLEEEVYPRFTLARGLPYAISTTLHYVLVVAGFLAAVSALGFDMTKLTILAGAFTVGVGFGLQNIFNNFVSGLILLFERPVQVGDVIQLDDNTQGLVERIGIRASVVRVSSGPEVIVPNGKLISERVINWTLHGRRRSVEIPVAVVSGSDWKKGLAIMERVGAMHPLVLKAPPPRALITRMGPDWWVLDLRIWTDRPEDWMEIRSEVAVAAGEALKAEGIAVK